MNSGLLWFLGLAVISLSQALVLVLRLNQGRPNKKNKKPENPTHGERLVALETDMENIKEDIRKIEEKLNKK